MKYQYEPLSDEYEFQTFLKDLFNAIYNTTSFEEYGSKGHTQFGIDIYSAELKVGIQAKKKDINRSKKSLIRELTLDLEKTLQSIEEFPHEIKHLIFATTTNKLIEIQNICLDYSSSQDRQLQFYCWADIQTEIAKHDSIRNTYYPKLKENRTDDLIFIRERLEQLEQLINEQNTTLPNKKIDYRSIPDCEILLPPIDLEAQKFLIAFILKTAAIQTFKDVAYKKFTCLINFSHTYTQYGDGKQGPGFSILSGEVVFLGNCSRLIKKFQFDKDAFWKLYEMYEEDTHYNRINFRMVLLPNEELISYEFEIDGQTGFYNFFPRLEENLDYDKLDSLNSVLPFIASTTKLGLKIIEFDKLKYYPAITKFIYCMLLENSFKLTSLRVNINDFDDWDFIYKIPKHSDSIKNFKK